MPLSASSLICLSHAARVTLESGRGEALEDVQRIVAAIGSERPEPMAALMKGACMDAMEVAGLVRAGLITVLNAGPAMLCERCHRPPSQGTSLCQPCRRYLGWARLMGEEVPDAPPVLRSAKSGGASVMHTRR